MNRAASAALDDAVGAFVADLVPEVESLAASVRGIDGSRLRSDVVVDAYNLACGFIDADGLHTDDELSALIRAFGHRMTTDMSRATPRALRDAGVIAGRRSYLERPSTLLDILVRSDVRDGGERAATYTRRAAQIGHAIAALDLLPSRTELLAVERFRGMVQRTVDTARAEAGGKPPAGGPPPPPRRGPDPRPTPGPRPSVRTPTWSLPATSRPRGRSRSCWRSSTRSSASPRSSARC